MSIRKHLFRKLAAAAGLLLPAACTETTTLPQQPAVTAPATDPTAVPRTPPAVPVPVDPVECCEDPCPPCGRG